MFPASQYLDFSHTEHAVLFSEHEPVWTAIGKIATYLEQLEFPESKATSISPLAEVGPRVYLGEGSVVEAGAVIKGPAYIGKNCQIRSGAYIRENVIVGDGCVLGNSCEFKNCVVFDSCEVPHYNYVGDAILGYKAHLGAGVILSNVRLDRGEVLVKSREGTARTGLNKFSAIIGDWAEIGCNTVISPGSLIGRRSVVYPCASFSGVLPEASILKLRQQHEIVQRQD